MNQFIIQGGTPLHGEITPSGNKNAALPFLAACLLTADPVILHNVPEIRDIQTMRLLLESLGVEITQIDNHTWKVQAKEIVGMSGEQQALAQERLTSKLISIGVLKAGATVDDVLGLQKVSGAFSGMQSLDWAYLLGIASAAVNRRMALSVIGNNLSFRKKAYFDVGGYRSLKFSVTEDYSLFKAIVGSGKWDYLYPVEADRVVTTEPCTTWGGLVRQKHRWGTGGLDMRLYGFYIMVGGFGMHFATILALLAGSVAVGTTGLMLKFLADYLFLYTVLKKIGKKELLRHFYAFELYYMLYVIALPFIVFFGIASLQDYMAHTDQQDDATLRGQTS